MKDPLSRRDVLKKTIFFSTSMMGSALLPQAFAKNPRGEFSEPGLHLLAFGDFGNARTENQARVAAQMAKFAKELGQPLDGALALGDNFYGKMTPERFDLHFEKMYDKKALPCPFYACIGNHDYEKATYGRDPEPRKCEIQLEYTQKNPDSRWKMPSKWYTLELPNPENPIVKIIVLDSNFREGDLTPQEKLAQQRFVEKELAKESKASWLWLMMHHPPYTETTRRKDNSRMINLLDETFKNHPIDLCIGGHDHNLQHLQVEGYDTSFIISGAGGAGTYEVNEEGRGFSKQVWGFNHFRVTKEHIECQFIDVDGNCLHAFRRSKNNKVEVIA